MALRKHKSARLRFTWRNRKVKNNSSHHVLGPCKDQRYIAGQGKCTYMVLATAMEAHARLNSIPDPELSFKDIESQGMELKKDDICGKKGRLQRCIYALQTNGALRMSKERGHASSEGRIMITKSKCVDTKDTQAVNFLVKHYFPVGPLIEVFGVHGDYLDQYSSSEIDEIHFCRTKQELAFTHCVSLPGFGVQASCPFWEFQNTYGPKWRGAAHGFGLLFALDLIELYGIKL